MGQLTFIMRLNPDYTTFFEREKQKI